jgi:hypothetical protein
MIYKNITFLVPVAKEADFLRHAQALTSPWVEDIQGFKLIEQVDPESVNYTLQIKFEEASALEYFDTVTLVAFINTLQEKLKEPVLFFESHLHPWF